MCLHYSSRNRWNETQAFKTVEGTGNCRNVFSCRQTAELATNSTSKTAGFQISQLPDANGYISLSIAYFTLYILENT